MREQKTGYIYLLRAEDNDKNVLNKYGYSKNFPQRRLYYWRSKLKIGFEFCFIVKCYNYKKLENQIKWYISGTNSWFIIDKTFELSVGIENEVKNFIKSSKYLKEVIYEK